MNLNHILRKLTRLPSPQNDAGALDSERALLRQRHKMNVEYLVTDGKGRGAITSDDLKEVERRVQDVQGVVDGKFNECVYFSETMLTWQY